MSNHYGVNVSYYLIWTAILIWSTSVACGQNFGNVSATTSYSPIYRPSEIEWLQIKTPHFKIIYPSGHDSLAKRSASILENEYKEAQQLVGGKLNNLPVILNTYNASGNGYVTPVNFRMEIYTNPIIGKSQNPMNSGWLENVLSHELIHANHFNQEFSNSTLGLINIFSPDAARGTMGLMAPGMFEGLAVEHESHGVEALAGRGNYSYFTGHFQTVFQSEKRMNLGQMMHRSLDTRPLGRHYLGGYEFIHWLHNNYGNDTSTEAFDFYKNWPFLGYGTALRHATDKWPWQLYNQFENYKTNQYQKNSSKISDNDKDQYWDISETPFKGEKIRRPSWIDNSNLLFHGSFYNKPSGFYKWDVGNEKPHYISGYQPVEDFQYKLANNNKSFVFTAYDTHPIYDEYSQTGLIEINLGDESIKSLLKDQNESFYAPFYNSNGNVEVLNQVPDGTEWLISNRSNNRNYQKLYQFDSIEIISIDPHPEKPTRLAAIINEQGRQGLYIVNRSNIKTIENRAPDIWFNDGSVFDAVWHPDGKHVLFTVERNGRMHIHQYNNETHTLVKFDAPYINTYEPTLSPDKTRLAAVAQVANEEKLVIANYGKLSSNGDTLYSKEWNSYQDEFLNPDFVNYQLPDDYQTRWNAETYSSEIDWLKPRTLKPGTSMRGEGYGMSFLSINELRNQAYDLELKYYSDRIWYHVSYTNKTFFPGFNVSGTDEPEDVFINTADPDIGDIEYVRQRRSYQLSLPFDYSFSSNPRLTTLSISPSLEYEQFRPQDGKYGNNIPFFNRTKGSFNTTFSYNLDQKLRDVQPYTGSYIYFSTEHDLSSSEQKTLTTNKIISNRWIEFPIGYSQNRHAYLTGAGGYLAIPGLRRWNQSLRIQGSYLWQNTGLSTSDYSIYKKHFSNSSYFIDQNNRRQNKNLVSLDTRYTIPILYPDKQGFFIPAGIYNIYAVLFSDTVFNFNANSISRIFNTSRNVLGIGLRTQFRVSIATLDIGIGISYDFWSEQSDYFIGSF